MEERWRESEAGRLWARFEAAWPQDWWLARDPDKAALLKDLGLTVSVRIHPMQKVSAQKDGAQKDGAQKSAGPRIRGRGPFRPRQRCGLCEIEIVCSLLGAEGAETLRVRETAQELEDYNLLRRAENTSHPEAERQERCNNASQ